MTQSAAGTGRPAESEVVLGLVAAPGAGAELAAALAGQLPQLLAQRHPGARWRVVLVRDALVTPPAEDLELVEATRARLLAEDWDLAVALTDLPLEVGRRPVVAHASPLHGVGLLCVPALGAVAVPRRAREAVLRLVDGLLGAADLEPDHGNGPASRGALTGRIRELAADTDADSGAGSGDGTVRFTARVLTGNLRLLAGMVRANQPWRLALRLSRALTAAVATGVFALVTSDIWALADAYGPGRLAALGLASILAIATTLIAGAGLWERARHRRAREQVVLFNLATTATVVLGVAALYAALFVLSLLGAALLVVPDLLVGALGHDAGAGAYAKLAWLTTTLATVGGDLGAGLETDEAVREAAYTYRTNQHTERAGD